MAKIKFTAFLAEARGKLAGTVFSKNRGGNYVRTKVTPVNPQTSSQVAVRNQLTAFAQNFRALTAAQIAAWNTAVSNFTSTDIFGDIKTPAGINLYNKLNINLALAGQAAIVNPPLPTGADACVIESLVSDVSSSLFTIDTDLAAVPAGHSLIIEATPQLSPGKSFVKSEFRVIEVLAAATAFPYLAGPTYIAKFGVPIAGQKVFCRIKTINNTTGEASGYSQISTISIP